MQSNIENGDIMRLVLYVFLGAAGVLATVAAPSNGASFSGTAELDRQFILVSEKKPYQGSFDVTALLPQGEDFVLTKAKITFEFQDDREWAQQLPQSTRQIAGEVVRHSRTITPSARIAGQTDHYVTALVTEILSNPSEVAELTIGRNIYYGTTSRRQEVIRTEQGRRKILLGTYTDAGDQGRVRRHVRITDTTLEQRRDGYDGAFVIKNKFLDVTSLQDLARTGRLDFSLAGKGDYTFIGATLWYEGFAAGSSSEGAGAGAGSGDGVASWTLLLSGGVLSFGGLFWWRNRAHRSRPQIRQYSRHRAF